MTYEKQWKKFFSMTCLIKNLHLPLHSLLKSGIKKEFKIN